MSRSALRTGIAQFFGGATYDSDARIYRPTPLAAFGLAGVRPYWTKQFLPEDWLVGMPDGTLSSAVMCVHLAQQSEAREAFGGVTSGVKREANAVELWIFHRADPAVHEEALAQLDDLIDAIKARIHSDRTLGGACVQAGEGGTPITSSTSLPVTTGAATVETEAVISFQADLYPGV